MPRRDVFVARRPALRAAEALEQLVAGGHSRAPVAGPAGPRRCGRRGAPADWSARPGRSRGTCSPRPVPARDAEGLRRACARCGRSASSSPGGRRARRDRRHRHDGGPGRGDRRRDLRRDRPRRAVGGPRADGAMLLPGHVPDPRPAGHRRRRASSRTRATTPRWPAWCWPALGHIPTAPGEMVTLPQFTAEVVEMTGRAITRVRLRAVPPTVDTGQRESRHGRATRAATPNPNRTTPGPPTPPLKERSAHNACSPWKPDRPGRGAGCTPATR